MKNEDKTKPVMEELMAYAIMLKNGMVSKTEYYVRLDELFLENPADEVLLEIEWEPQMKLVIGIIERNIDYNNFDINKFGKSLMWLLEKVYTDSTNIKFFAQKAYDVWLDIPYHIQELAPFFILDHADDFLASGNEAQARELYESAFNYYKF